MISAMNTLDIQIWHRHQFPGCELLLVINLNVGSIVKSKRVLLVPSPVDGRRRDGKSFLVGVLSTSNYSHEIFISSIKGFRPSLSFFPGVRLVRLGIVWDPPSPEPPLFQPKAFFLTHPTKTFSHSRSHPFSSQPQKPLQSP
jgi:hypothetical protein